MCVNGTLVGGISLRGGKVGPERPETKPTVALYARGGPFIHQVGGVGRSILQPKDV